MNNFYVYIYRNPLKDNIPFYIGKGKNNRMYDHLKETVSTTNNRRKFFTIQKIIESGCDPAIEIVKDNLTEDEAYSLEKQLIEKYGRAGYDIGGILTNVCFDNKPPSHKGKPKSIKHRKSLSESHKGKFVSQETREKHRRITNERIKNGDFGHNVPHTEETKKKISQAKQGRTQTKESNLKRSNSLKNKPWSEARRTASIQGNKSGPPKGKPWSEARRLAYESKKNGI